jgi:predicted transport protein
MVARDEEGQELSDEQAARSSAFASAREMACVEVQKGHLHLGHRVEVEDESGTILATVQFRDVVEIEA